MKSLFLGTRVKTDFKYPMSLSSPTRCFLSTSSIATSPHLCANSICMASPKFATNTSSTNIDSHSLSGGTYNKSKKYKGKSTPTTKNKDYNLPSTNPTMNSGNKLKKSGGISCNCNKSLWNCSRKIKCSSNKTKNS